MQAVLILAHNDPKFVYNLGKVLSNQFEVYIHFDTKCVLTLEDKKKFSEANLNVYSIEDVKWGSWSIVKATIYLMEQALNNKNIEYVHLISGQDWPVKSVKEIYDFYCGKNEIFLSCHPAKNIKKTGESIENWQKFYFNYDVINRKSLLGKIYHRVSFWGQYILCIDKLKHLNLNIGLYHGSQWADLPRDAVEFLLKEINDNRKFQKLFSTGFCSDEFWMQTILYNKECYRSRIVVNNHRYIKWTYKHGSSPAILDEEEYSDICESDCHFARKLTREYSYKLIKLLGVN